MKQTILQIKLKRIAYRGANIGRDLVFRFSDGTRQEILRKRIKNGTEADFDQEITSILSPNGQPAKISLAVSITEYDKRSPDTASQTVEFRFDPGKLTQALQFKMQVEEAPSKSKPKIAEFEFELQVEPRVLIAGKELQPANRNPNFPMVAIISDLFFGIGNELETFSQADEEALLALIDKLDNSPGDKVLVIAGNFLELWMSGPPLPSHLPEADLLAGNKERLEQILDVHSAVFNRLQSFMGRIVYVPGAHDQDLRFPLLQQYFRQISGITFEFAEAYYNKELQLLVDAGDRYDLGNQSLFPGGESLFRSLYQDFGATYSAIKDLGHPLAVHFDSFSPAKNYKEYVGALREKIPQPRVMNPGEADQIADYVRSQSPTPVLSQAGLDRIANFLQSLTNKDLLEDVGFMGEAYHTSLRKPGKIAAARSFQESEENKGPTRCLALGYTRESSIQGLPRGLKMLSTGGWKQTFRHNPNDPAAPIPLPYRQISLIYADSTGTEGNIRLFNLPDFTPVGMGTYRFTKKTKQTT